MVRCADCGFLAILQTSPQRGLVEVDRELRDGNLPALTSADGIRLAFRPLPICFLRKFELEQEYRKCQSPGHPNEPKDFSTVINSQRQCDGFVKWVQGFSPREHHEIIEETELRENQREREEADCTWRERQAEQARRQARWMVIATWIGPILGALGTVVAGWAISHFLK